MLGLNRVFMVGNLVADVNFKQLKNTGVLEGRLAVSNNYKTLAGEVKEDTCFIDVEMYGKNLQSLEQYFTKGRRVLVEGRLVMDQWNDKTTNDLRTRYHINVSNMQFVDGPRTDGSSVVTPKEVPDSVSPQEVFFDTI